LNRTIELLTEHVIGTIRTLPGVEDRKTAQRLLDIHLHPLHYAMHVHDDAIEQQLIDLCQRSGDLEAADSFLVFEQTRTIRGIVRVLARTHLNRQGVAGVTRGARRKTLSPRVMGLFDVSDSDVCAWLDYRTLIDAWIDMAERNTGDEKSAESHFSASDVTSLKALARLSADDAKKLRASEVRDITNLGWARVVLGLYTGLVYLHERYGFDADKVWARLDSVNSPEEVSKLSLDAQQNITEFGKALAPSFFADLGSGNFVKPDVHVRDVAAAICGHSVDADEAVQFVRQLAARTEWAPRKVDKLLYFACIGKLYLAGLEPEKATATARKTALMAALGNIGI
jgi:hypothetical protein